MIFRLTNELSNTLVRKLQEYFGTSPWAEEYRWSPGAGPDEHRLRIAEFAPDQEFGYPYILVKGIVGPTQRLGFSDAAGPLFDETTGDHIGDSFQGLYNPRVEFVVASTSDHDVQRITDILLIGMVRRLAREIREETQGNVYANPPDVTVNGRSKRELTTGTSEFQITLSQQWTVVWHDEVLYEDTLETVENIVTVTDC